MRFFIPGLMLYVGPGIFFDLGRGNKDSKSHKNKNSGLGMTMGLYTYD